MRSDPAVETLARAVHGRLLRPGDDGYDAARRVWNAMIDRRPALVVQPAGVADVRSAVEFARERGYELAVRGGGHNIAGTGVCEGGVLLDLGSWRGVQVDPDARTAQVEPGARLGDLDRACEPSGLATPGGVVSSTGVAGLTLGGGFGWLARRHGLAADNLLSVDLVTAEGRLVRASREEEPDLFWALRGGGGNFGVVTRFTFRLHPLPREILFGPTVYRLEDATAVLRRYRDFCGEAPRACCVWADLFTAPPLPSLPEALHGTKVLSLMQCYAGDADEGRRVLAPLHTVAEPVASAVAPRPYSVAQTFLDETYAHGARNYWSSQNHDQLADETIDALVRLAADLPTPESDVLVAQLGGAIDDVASEATAYPHRGVRFVLTPGARWREPEDDARCTAWARAAGEALARGASGGAYSNFVPEAEGAEDSAYGMNVARLRRVKRRYDPGNLFRVNLNIAPG